jgi:predicted N-acyltransferase
VQSAYYTKIKDLTPFTVVWAPWYVVRSDDKRRARLNIIAHLLSKVKYKKVSRDKVKLPKRKAAKKYKASHYPFKFIPETY